MGNLKGCVCLDQTTRLLHFDGSVKISWAIRLSLDIPEDGRPVILNSVKARRQFETFKLRRLKVVINRLFVNWIGFRITDTWWLLNGLYFSVGATESLTTLRCLFQRVNNTNNIWDNELKHFIEIVRFCVTKSFFGISSVPRRKRLVCSQDRLGLFKGHFPCRRKIANWWRTWAGSTTIPPNAFCKNSDAT